jgi:uncharacterized protein involved in exopolysaccharide biosynthesis
MQPPAKLSARARASEPYGGDASRGGREPDLGQFASPTQRANRRKLLVFLGVLLLVGAASLVYTFARPAEYRASARVQINPGSVQVESIRPTGGSQGTDAPRPFLTELQVLTSRPVVEAAVKRLGERFEGKISILGSDPVSSLQSSLMASPTGGTDVVELAATGGDAGLVAALVNEVIATYKEQLEQAYRDTSGEALAQIDDELTKLAARVAARRKAVDDFSARHNVVSLEREENQVLARVRGLGTALNNANEKLAAAEGKLRSLEEAAAQGKSVVRARDNPTLANLEQRASQIREELRELERSYTPEYLVMDSRVRAQRARLAELEQQLASQRQLSLQSSLAEAQEEVASARETASRIRQQIAGDRGTVQAFSARFNEYRALREELTQLESLHRDTAQRKAKLEAGERARRPAVKVVEAANIPQEPWRPLYMRDAAISIAGSFLLALLAMWVVEIFNRHDPRPTILVPQPIAIPIPGRHYGGGLGASSSGRPVLSEMVAPGLPAGTSGLLTVEPTVPRELAAGEIGGLLAAATTEARLAALLLLSGLSPEELVALDWDDIDPTKREIHVSGASPRTVAILEPTFAILERLPRTPGTRLLAAHGAAQPTLDDLTSDLLCAAYDAGIERPAEVTPATLRHTYIAFLARQGIRLADLVRLVGRLSAEQVAFYSDYAPAGKRLTLDEINAVVDGTGLARSAESGTTS